MLSGHYSVFFDRILIYTIMYMYIIREEDSDYRIILFTSTNWGFISLHPLSLSVL